ncbi:MAG: nucleotidyltransferase domain-containing protein [Halanaerobiales bacterium]|nr:nucleotidyltransferase domain-containing protein [Halanaerobiales bacterium]
MTPAEALHEIKSRLLSQINPKSIILFGSIAKGTNNQYSDIDLLIIWDENSKMTNIQRRIKLRDIIGFLDYPLDILTCTTNEFRQALTDPNSFTTHIVKEGEIIYGRLN